MWPTRRVAIQKVTFPTLGSGFAGGGDDLSEPLQRHLHVDELRSTSGSKNVTAANNVSNTSTSPFTLVRDVTAPDGRSAHA